MRPSLIVPPAAQADFSLASISCKSEATGSIPVMTVTVLPLPNPFDELAAEYDAWFESECGRAVFAQEVECLRRIMSPATGGGLEVGVGTGRFAAALGVTEGIVSEAGFVAMAFTKARIRAECGPNCRSQSAPQAR